MLLEGNLPWTLRRVTCLGPLFLAVCVDVKWARGRVLLALQGIRLLSSVFSRMFESQSFSNLSQIVVASLPFTSGLGNSFMGGVGKTKNHLLEIGL